VSGPSPRPGQHPLILIGSDPKFDGKMISVRVDTLQRPDGSSFRREVVSYGQAVVLVPVDADGSLLLVRQYRHAVGEWLLELPAGGIDEGEAPEAAAQRELREETGHRGALTRIGGMFLAPGYSDEFQHIFAATGLVADALDADEDEEIELARVPLSDVLSLVDRGEIRDAKSLAGLLLFLRWRERAGDAVR
jgi:ADP-ribose pyrophosphatase